MDKFSGTLRRKINQKVASRDSSNFYGQVTSNRIHKDSIPFVFDVKSDLRKKCIVSGVLDINQKLGETGIWLNTCGKPSSSPSELIEFDMKD